MKLRVRFRARRLAQYVLTLTGVGLLGWCAFAWVDAKYFEVKEDREFTASLKNFENAPGAGKPVLPNPELGSVLGRMEIPRLGLTVMVVEGDDTGDLKRAAGHIPGTALPGQAGNTGIAAHRDTYFRPLKSIEAGDTITVETLGGTYRYRVVSTKIVAPNENQVLLPTGAESLTLVTCYPFYYVGPAPKRFIVRAERVRETS